MTTSDPRSRIPTQEWGTGSGAIHPVVDAYGGGAIGSVRLATVADVDRAGVRARTAQPEWADSSFRERIAVLRRAEGALERLTDELRPLMQRETGAIAAKAAHEIEKTIDELRAAAQLPDHPDGVLLPHERPEVLSMARRVPVGVVGVIAPWNAPLMLAMRSIAPALALGNAVLLKPDPKTPLSGGSVIDLVFREAGLPPDVFQVVPGGADVGEALVGSPHTDMIAFTGSSAAGRRVGSLAGGLLKRVSLELGGNNAFIVLDDADLDRAVATGLRGSFAHQGQICMATGRHLVHESIADEYVERMVAHADAMTVGDPIDPGTDLGPLIDERQAARVEQIVTDSVAAGARLRTGGTRDGTRFAPTVLDDVDRANPAFEAEIFGPVVPVSRFATDDEALELASATDYGLSAAIHSRDVPRALALARRLRTGMVHINGQTVADSAHVPMGGMGASGNGSRFGGHWNLEEFTQWQWVTAESEA